MMMGNFGVYGWLGLILNLIITVGVIAGLVWLVVWAVRRVGGTSTPNSAQGMGGQSARDIAQARYAKGEINREEYQQIISDLGH